MLFLLPKAHIFFLPRVDISDTLIPKHSTRAADATMEGLVVLVRKNQNGDTKHVIEQQFLFKQQRLSTG